MTQSENLRPMFVIRQLMHLQCMILHILAYYSQRKVFLLLTSPIQHQGEAIRYKKNINGPIKILYLGFLELSLTWNQSLLEKWHSGFLEGKEGKTLFKHNSSFNLLAKPTFNRNNNIHLWITSQNSSLELRSQGNNSD